MKKLLILTILYVLNVLFLCPYIFNYIYVWAAPITFGITTYFYISFIYKFFKQLNNKNNEEN